MDLRTLPHFFNNRVYNIPSYQRGYSWEDEQVKDLLNDLYNSIRLQNTHYAGTITLHKQPDTVKIGLSHYQLYDVVDGQQRFVTIILILSYIIETLKNNEAMQGEAAEKAEMYLMKKGSYIFNYSVDEVGSQYFRSAILELEKKTTLQENLYTGNMTEAKETIRKFFKNKTYRGKEIEFLEALENRLYFNEYIVTNTSDIGVVFETMNNRGKGLSTLELVKNRLLYLTSKLPYSPERESEIRELNNEINSSWGNILRNLTLPEEVLNEDTFLNNHWIIYHGWTKDNVAKTEILKDTFTIEKLVLTNGIFFHEIKNYLKSLTACSLLWRYINFPDEATALKEVEDVKKRSAIRTSLQKLSRLNNSTVKPLLLAAFHHLKTKPDDVYDIVKLSEIFSFRVYSMSRRRADTGKPQLFRYSKSIVKGNSVELQYSKYLLSRFIDEYGSKDRFEWEIDENFKSKKKEGYYSWSGLAYFLFEYEESLRKDNDQKVDYSFAAKKTKSIEHVYPQTPKDKYWKERFQLSPTDKKKALHSLGNLVLISKVRNSEFQNLPFPDKSKGKVKFGNSYANGSYAEIEISQMFNHWTPVNIKKREKALLRFMDDRWQLNEILCNTFVKPPNTEDLEIFEEENGEE